MHVTAHLGIDVVALDVTEDVTCLVELTAPVADAVVARPGQTLVIVLDRSGSMEGEPLEGAKRAIQSLIQRLAPQDRFGLVVFDDSADVVIPVREMSDHDLPSLYTMVSRIRSGGSTDLSAGYLLGLREAKREVRHVTPVGATVLLVSDGHANAGVTDPAQVHDLATKANAGYRITTSTLGLGLGYDEILLAALSRGGLGTHAFAPDIDVATHELQNAVSDLLEKSVVAAQMRIRPVPSMVDRITLMQDLPHQADGDAIVVSIGDMYAGESRKTLFVAHVPGIDRLGTETIATVTFEYTALPLLEEHVVEIPISVNVVPGDQARNRVPNPVVEVERLLAEVDRSKKSAITSLRSHDRPGAEKAITEAINEVKGLRDQIAAVTSDPDLLGRIDEATVELMELESTVKEQDLLYSSKRMMDSYSNTSRGRQRRQRPVDADPTDDSHTGS